MIFDAVHPLERPRPSSDGAAVRAELIAAGLLVPAVELRRFRAQVSPECRLDSAAIVAAAATIAYYTPPRELAAVLTRADPPVAEALRRIVERRQAA